MNKTYHIARYIARMQSRGALLGRSDFEDYHEALTVFEVGHEVSSRRVADEEWFLYRIDWDDIPVVTTLETKFVGRPK